MIGIIYYGAGNIFSLTAALDRLNITYGMIKSPQDFEKHDRYIIPGVGHAGSAMQKLNESGMIPAIRSLKKPVLGICVGMQLLSVFSEEGNSELTGIIPLHTLLFNENLMSRHPKTEMNIATGIESSLKTKENTKDLKLKVPHTGWNKVFPHTKNALFCDINEGSYFYFVHSYFIEFNSKFTTASAEYGIKFSAAVQKNNFYGVQFHPEKSGLAGEQLLKNFAHLA